MLLFLKKKAESTDKSPIPVSKKTRSLSDFVPFYSHFNPHTIVTKNGELLQVIKISSNNRGLNYESGDATQNTVRDNIRRGLTESIHTDSFAIWIHTLRKRKPVSFSAKLNEPFANYVYDRWQKKNRWKYQYYNEIYITVVYTGQAADMMDKQNLSRVMSSKRNRNFRNDYMDKAYAELDAAVNSILQKIGQNYNATRLSMAERISSETGQAIFYSEPMEFFSNLLNLHSQPYPVPEADISVALCNHKIVFGFNALESKTTGGMRRFAALLSLKQYREVTPETVDRILQAPSELIISQAFHYIPHTLALKQYKEQKDLFDMSGDTYSIAASGLEEMLQSYHKTPVDFGKQQTSIMVLSDEYKNLDSEVGKIQEGFSELGLITVREDIKLEECFWAQLPGNFEFLRRTSFISTPRIAGFTRLNLFPNGNNLHNHWGESVTLIPTKVNSPYFFNFHYQDNGHTVIFDYNSFHDSKANVMLNFLVAASLKYQPKLFIFDRRRSAHLFFDKLGGKYHTLMHKHERYGHHQHFDSAELNPFSLEDTPRNRSFLLAWCIALIEPKFPLDDSHKALLKETIDQLYQETPEHRNLSGFVHRITAIDTNLGGAFSEFHGRGKLAGTFDAQTETLDLSTALHAFDMDMAIDELCVVPLFAYLLHRIITEIDGRPTIIVMHDAWNLLENAFFAPRLGSLLEMLRQNNVAVIFTTSNPQHITETHIFKTVMQNCITRLYIPDDVYHDYESGALGLTKYDSKRMARMDRQKGDFLLKQSQEDIGLRINLNDIDDIHAIFANDIKNLIAAGGPYASLPQS